MKKLITGIIFACVCFTASAKVFVQADANVCGAFITHRHDCFNQVQKNYFDPDFNAFNGCSVASGWEFNSKDTETPFHWFTGFDVGFDYYGFTFMPVVGLNWTCLNLGSWNMELSATAAAGVTAGIFGDYYFTSQTSLDLIFCKNSRNGLYGGIGLTNLNIPDGRYYKGYGLVYTTAAYLGPRLIAGVRL